MFLEIIKFAFKGIEINIQSTVPIEVIHKRLKRYSLRQALLGNTQRVVAQRRNGLVKLYRLGVPVLILGKPVLYTKLIVAESGTHISGRFTFPFLSRVLFWLGHIAVLTLGSLGIFRIVIAHTYDEPIVWYLYGTFAILLCGLIGFLIYSWYGWTWHNRSNDLATLANTLELLCKEHDPNLTH